MNLFILDTNPRRAAAYHCDRHIVKMPLETAQMLVSAFYVTFGLTSRSEIAARLELVHALFEDFPRQNLQGEPWPYGLSHVDHPCSIWVRECDHNFAWATALGQELCAEYNRRYHRTHACAEIIDWCAALPNPAPPAIKRTPFAQALPEHLRHTNAVIAYRAYYKEYKARFAKWNHSPKPHWW